MTLKLDPELEDLLRDAARRQQLSLSELVERILRRYLTLLPDNERVWVQVTQSRLSRVWGTEDFSDWEPHTL